MGRAGKPNPTGYGKRQRPLTRLAAELLADLSPQAGRGEESGLVLAMRLRIRAMLKPR